MLFLATVPLLVAGTVDRTGPPIARGGTSRPPRRRVGDPDGGIVVVYTALVAGLGQLVGGSGPTWFLVASTGAIAIALEPVRRRIRRLADRLVYGSRDDPLVAVQRMVDRVGSGAATTCCRPWPRRCSVSCGSTPSPSTSAVTTSGSGSLSAAGRRTHHREVLLRHRDEVVGRLVVGWEQGPTLRPRDEPALTQLTGPLTPRRALDAAGEELRRSNMATLWLARRSGGDCGATCTTGSDRR